MFGVLMRTCVW